ncbi:hypothetical protein ARMSODRAFT_953416 [Armillaria solidipes]|uniref:Uncharacterized protein n=1 Tax=Armillaria solidipes TaxID=1076256 RepID=A0A2H3BVH4_9AGAR|nr:hypothetical protein ARMSODRAFT_953416 [Armillaria solidipes]
MSKYDSKGYSHWADFYQLPIKNQIAGTYWIDFLWEVLHRDRKTPLSYNAAEHFASAAIGLIDLFLLPSYWEILIWPFTRPHITRVLCTVDTILDSEQHLSDAYYSLIGDILREIDSDGAVFSASLRSRCKTASLTIKREMWMLQKVMNKQGNDFNPKRIRLFYSCLFYCSVVLCLLAVGLTSFFLTSSLLVTRGLSFAYIMAFLAYGAEEAHVYMAKVPRAVRKLHSETLTFIWAWRDMRGLFALISKSESLQLSNCSRAKKFLMAFQTSFMGGRVELWKTRSKIQALSGFADKIQTMKDQDMLMRRRRTKCPWYRGSARNALRLGRATLASVYSKVWFGISP